MSHWETTNGVPTFVIAVEPPGRCEICGATDELRPYGPNGENSCFDCATKDGLEAATQQFHKRLDSVD